MKFRDTLNLSFRRTATCLDVFAIIVFMWFDHRLEKNQLEAARIVSGLASCASILSIYKETGWEKLSVRREKRKLSLFYDIVSGQSPDYLQDLLHTRIRR
jgi:hypothetical protein